MTETRRPDLQFTVRGLPAPQGSKDFKGLNKQGRAILVESSKLVKPWRQDVIVSCIDAMEALGGWKAITGAAHVVVEFYMPRPKSQPKGRRTLPVSLPDLDKLIRSTDDALKTAGVYRDDSCITDITIRKRYVVQDEALGHAWELPGSGAVISVFELDPESTWADQPLDLLVGRSFAVPQLPPDLVDAVSHIPVVDLADVLGQPFVIGTGDTDSKALLSARRVLALIEKRQAMPEEMSLAQTPAVLIVENGLTRLASVPGKPMSALQDIVEQVAVRGRDFQVEVLLTDRVRERSAIEAVPAATAPAPATP